MGLQLLLRFAHVVFGALWVGTAVFIAFFLMPSLRAIGPSAGALMQYMTQVRRLPLYMMTLMVITLLSGGTLAWRDAGEAGFAWFQQGPGRVFGAGAMLALVAAGVGMGISSPTSKRLGALAGQLMQAGRAPTAGELAEMQALQRRLAQSATIVAIILLLATAAMATARYTV